MRRTVLFVLLMVAMAVFGCFDKVFAHCDTLEGPVIQDAKTALKTGDVTPVLKWVPQKQEGRVRSAFARALKDRAKAGAPSEKADMGFFEILVRIHRESEGAPFTGIKPAGTPPEPAVVAADEAIAAGSPSALVREISQAVREGIEERFHRVLEAHKHMNDSVEAGRAYVAAYVEYTHYVEAVHEAAVKGAVRHHGAGPAHE